MSSRTCAKSSLLAKSRTSAGLLSLVLLACSSTRPVPPGSTGLADVGVLADAAGPDAGMSSPDAGASSPDAEPAPDASAPIEAADLLRDYLSGRFDSADQATSDPRYFAIQLWICPVDAPELGPRVLYVEQARSDSLAQPYRQRLYVIDPIAEDPQTRAVSRVFELTAPARSIGLCERAELGVFTASDATEKVGCGVFMAHDGDHFTGATRDRDCPSSLNGASYTSSEVELRAEQMTSWDRGYDGAGAQVWGATAGPYRFVRRTPLQVTAR